MTSVTNEGSVSSGMFIRRSSGLVRTVTTLDTLFYCLIQAAIPYVVFNFAVWSFYPGASMEIAMLMALVGSLCVGVTYALFSAVYPRSGGEYVFLSRTTHPLIGFVASFGNTFWQIMYFGINGAFAASIGVAPFFTMVGFQAHSEIMTSIGKFVDSPWGWFIVGALIILFFSYQLLQGMRTYFSIQKWMIFFILFGFGVFILTLVLGSAGVFNFQANFDQYAGSGAYNNLIATASSQGVDLKPQFSFKSTSDFIVWPAFSLLFAVLSVSFSGEIKNIRRGQLYAIVGANLLGGLIMLLITFFGRHAIGDQFLLAASTLGAVDPLPYPWLTLLASLLGGNIILTVIINLAVVLMLVYVAASASIYATRAMLAWSFDGLAPEKLGEVSDSRHTPTYTILVAAILGLAALALYSFTSVLRVLSGIAPMGFVFGLVSLVGALFPYIKRESYETSVSKIEIRGIPVMTITGAIGALVTGFVVYRSFVDNTYAANSPFSMGMFFGVFIAGAIWYFVTKWMRRRQGVDVDSHFKEIPIE